MVSNFIFIELCNENLPSVRYYVLTSQLDGGKIFGHATNVKCLLKSLINDDNRIWIYIYLYALLGKSKKKKVASHWRFNAKKVIFFGFVRKIEE